LKHPIVNKSQTKKIRGVTSIRLDLSQNVKIRDVPYSLKSPRNSEFKLAHIAIDSKCNCRSFSVYNLYENPSSATFNNCAWIIFSQSTSNLGGIYLLTGSLKSRSIDNIETQKKSISMKNSQFFEYLLYAKSK
jgi:hypothetical protein